MSVRVRDRYAQNEARDEKEERRLEGFRSDTRVVQLKSRRCGENGGEAASSAQLKRSPDRRTGQTNRFVAGENEWRIELNGSTGQADGTH